MRDFKAFAAACSSLEPLYLFVQHVDGVDDVVAQTLYEERVGIPAPALHESARPEMLHHAPPIGACNLTHGSIVAR